MEIFCLQLSYIDTLINLRFNINLLHIIHKLIGISLGK